MGFCDLGQMSEQCRPDAAQVVLMSDNDPDVSERSGRRDDHVVRYTNELGSHRMRRERTADVQAQVSCADELVEINRVQREEAEVAVMVGEVLMKCHNGLGVVGARRRNDTSRPSSS